MESEDRIISRMIRWKPSEIRAIENYIKDYRKSGKKIDFSTLVRDFTFWGMTIGSGTKWIQSEERKEIVRRWANKK